MLRAKHQSAQMSKITNDGLPWSGIGCFIAVPIWIGLCSVLRPLQHSIGYMGDGFYRSRDPTNSIEVLKENLQKTNQTTETTQNRHA